MPYDHKVKTLGILDSVIPYNFECDQFKMKNDTNKTEHKNANEEIDEQIVDEDNTLKKDRRIDCPMKDQEKILKRILKIVDDYVTINHRQCHQNRMEIDQTIAETVVDC